MSDQLASEMLAYDYMLERYREAGDTAMVRRLEAAPPTPAGPLPAAYLALRDAAMHGVGIGTTRAMRSVITGVFVPSWLSLHVRREGEPVAREGILGGSAPRDHVRDRPGA